MSKEDQTIHHSSNGGNPSKAVNSSSPVEPSGTFHGGSSPRGPTSHPFLLASSSPPSPHSNYFPKRDLLFRARSRSLGPADNPARPGNSVSEPEANTQVSVGLGVLSRAANTAKNNSPTRDFLFSNSLDPTNDPTRLGNFVSGPEANLANTNNFPKRDFLFREASNQARPTDFVSKPEANTHHVGLGVLGDLSRAPNINTKNLLHRPLATTHLPILSHWAPPVKVNTPNPSWARVGGMYSRLGTYLMQRVGTRVANVPSTQNGDVVNGNTTRMLSEHVLDDDNLNSPRKKAKTSSEDQSSRVGGSFVVIDNPKTHLPSYPTSAFMRYCFTCARKLRHDQDIYIFRGEMAFCSDECREREISIQEQREMMAEASSSASRVFRRNRTLRSLRELSRREG